MRTTLTCNPKSTSTRQGDHEESVKESFVSFLRANEGISCKTVGRHVSNRTGKANFDFLLLAENGGSVALEVTQLTREHQELIDSAHFDEFVRTVNEYVDQVTLPGTFMIHAPYGALGSLNEWKVHLQKYGPGVGNQIKQAAEDLQSGGERCLVTALDEIVIEKIDDRIPGSLSFSGESPNEHWGDYQGFKFVRDLLKRILKKKNNQLDTQANRRILMISNQLGFRVNTNRLWPPVAELVTKAISEINRTDPHLLSNIDEIFFEGELSKFEKVWAKFATNETRC